ncbi:ATPase-like protein [Tirmania nivea]|nr:ATPase-like protein [Tirmania nivea]
MRRFYESQNIHTSGESFHSVDVLFPEYGCGVAIAASLFLAFITVGYFFRSYKQWRYLKQGPERRHVLEPPKNNPINQIQADKALYHKLQNLSSYPECLPQARIRLLELLNRTVHEALTAQSNENTILSISEYSPEALHTFLNNTARATGRKFEQYTARRKEGGSREMLPTFEYAKYWIRKAAPVKYVDGSWLGGIHRLTTTHDDHRAASRVAWQILSEELGDGDLGKNHVAVYKQLVNTTGSSSIGLGHESRFISDVHNPNQEPQVWTAGVSQLLISLFPEEMLPEILGFNMAYECLPCHLLITIQELKELKLDPYYFILHVSIDNGHSGHAAMGAAAVTKYMDSLKTEQEMKVAWKRIQVGYMMAEGLTTTPTPITGLDRKVEKIFKDKCETAKPMHTFCKGNIGGAGGFGKSLSQWLDPERFDDWGLVFVKTIADSRWVAKGNPLESKLVKELKWGGRMFGAYTSDEVRAIEKWISGMKVKDTFPESRDAYKTFTGNDILSIPLPSFDYAIQPPSQRLNTKLGLQNLSSYHDLLEPQLPANITGLSSSILGTLLMLSATPFEYFPSYPSHVSTSEGMAAIRTLRALYGFPPGDGLCAGMDEVNRLPDDVIGVIELGRRLGGKKPPEIRIDTMLGRLCDYVTKLSRFPTEEVSRLLGCQIGFVSCVLTRESGLWYGAKGKRLASIETKAMEDIGARIMEAWHELLMALTEKASRIKWEEVVEGWDVIVSSILKIVQTLDEGEVRKPIKGCNRQLQQTGSRMGLMKGAWAVHYTDDIRGRLSRRHTQSFNTS